MSCHGQARIREPTRKREPENRAVDGGLGGIFRREDYFSWASSRDGGWRFLESSYGIRHGKDNRVTGRERTNLVMGLLVGLGMVSLMVSAMAYRAYYRDTFPPIRGEINTPAHPKKSTESIEREQG